MGHTRFFCCCLPVRFGVFVIAISGVIGGGLVSAVGWKRIADLGQQPLAESNKIALFIQTVMFTLLAVVSIFGFIGSILRRRRLISVYSTALFLHFGLSLGSGAFFLFSLFHAGGQSLVGSCEDGSAGAIRDDVCTGTVDVLRAVAVVVLVLVWLIELYGCVVVSRYASQLEEEAEDAAWAPAKRTVSSPIMMQGYGFSAPPNSFGVRTYDATYDTA